jgi:hypothetical protein
MFMSLFVVLSNTDNTKIEGAIKEKFPNAYYNISSHQWVVSAEGPAKQVAEKLGITDKEIGSGPALIFAVSGYWGWWKTDVWEWMKAKWEKVDG